MENPEYFEMNSNMIYLVAELDAVLDNGERVAASYCITEELSKLCQSFRPLC